MSDNLVLARLREIPDVLSELKADNVEIKHRLSTLEIQVGGLNATEQNHYASLSSRMDRLATDVDRIKRRLELADAPAL
jgi:ribosome-associated translation inhibitor RaiA